MSKSLIGLVGLLCLVACGTDAGNPAGAASDTPTSNEEGPGGRAPAAPGTPNVKAVAGDDAVQLSWEPVAGASSYDVARATSAGGEVKVATVTDAAFLDREVQAETTYFYTVTAHAEGVASASSAEVSATPFSFDRLHMRHNAQILRSIAAGGGVTVVVGDGMRVLRSTDGGTTWSDASVPGYGALSGVVWGAGKFVAVGDFGQVFTSEDGVTWTPQVSKISAALTGIAFGGQTSARFVAIGEKATVLSSADGISWTPIVNNLHHTQKIAFDYELRSIAYGGPSLDYFVVTATDGNGSSGFAFYVTGDADLTTWAPSPSGYSGYLSNGRINAVTVGEYEGVSGRQSSFHLVGLDGFWGHAEQSAPNTLTFSTVKAGTPNDEWVGVAFDKVDTMKVFSLGGKVMSCSVSGACKSALNGWVEEAVPASSQFIAAAFAGDRFIGVGSDELVVSRSTEADAKIVEHHRSSPSFPHLFTKSVAGSAAGVVAVGTMGGRYLYSSDGGMSFTSAVAPSNVTLWGAKLIGGELFMVGAGSTIARSSTGAPNSWVVASTTPTTEVLFDVASSGALFIAAGDKGAVFTSPDGSTWTHQPSSGHPIMSVAWEGTTFIATTADGHILTTTDGVAWNDVLDDSANQMSLEGLAVDGGTIVVTGSGGHVWLSTDHGAHWAPRHIAANVTLTGVARFAGTWVGGGSSDRPELWTSTDAISWKRRTAIPSTTYSVNVAAGTLFVAGIHGAVYSLPKPF